MATLTSGSWTVQLLHATGSAHSSTAFQRDVAIKGHLRTCQAILILTTGESPAAGVPWPDKGQFGMHRNVNSILLHNARARTGATVGPITASGVHVIAQMNVTGQKVRFFALGQASGTTQRALKQLATTVTLTGGARYSVTVNGW